MGETAPNGRGNSPNGLWEFTQCPRGHVWTLEFAGLMKPWGPSWAKTRTEWAKRTEWTTEYAPNGREHNRMGDDFNRMGDGSAPNGL